MEGVGGAVSFGGREEGIEEDARDDGAAFGCWW
jgi:hypothetical protein